MDKLAETESARQRSAHDCKLAEDTAGQALRDADVFRTLLEDMSAQQNSGTNEDLAQMFAQSRAQLLQAIESFPDLTKEQAKANRQLA